VANTWSCFVYQLRKRQIQEHNHQRKKEEKESSPICCHQPYFVLYMECHLDARSALAQSRHKLKAIIGTKYQKLCIAQKDTKEKIPTPWMQ
jgi:hypothetical protein